LAQQSLLFELQESVINPVKANKKRLKFFILFI